MGFDKTAINKVGGKSQCSQPVLILLSLTYDA